MSKYFASWHGRRALEFERGEIVERLQVIKRAHGPIMANRCLAVVRKMFSWAIRNGKLALPFNPAQGLDMPAPERERERVYSTDEVKSLWSAFGECGIPGAVFKMALITGQRVGEVAGMRLDEIEGDLWNLPGSRTKNKRPHVVPLNDMAQTLLEEQRPLSDTWVFPSPRGLEQPISNLGKAARGTNGKRKPSKRNVRALSGVKDFRAHDLRRTIATRLTRLGFSRFLVDRLLNHVEPGVGRVYDRYDYLKEKTEAMNAWSRHLASAVGEGGDVVQMVPKETA